MSVKIIDVNAKKWQSVLDFYEDVIKQVGAPDWHGRNVNALVDSIVYGGINTLEPPYIIRFHEAGGLPSDIGQELIFVKQAIEEARLERRNATGIDVNVALEII